MELNIKDKALNLTKKLVSINSVSGNEKKVADYIIKYFAKLDYFKANPKHLITVKGENNRNSVIAYLKGKTNKTILLMGHIDTVDIKDYGKAIKYATNTDKIKEELKKNFTLPNNVLADLDDDNYMFGRGTLDMKAGVAVYMCVFEYFVKHPEELNGSLVCLFEADEEGDSKGVIKALEELNKLKIKEKLEYKICLNGDYSTFDDLNRNVYLGTVGKILPCFVCIGKESHVGSPFDGFDPNLLSSIINKNISLNPDFSDINLNKVSVPPICLKQADNKDFYTVQTASSSFSYFNCMIYNSSPVKIMNKCLKLGKQSFDETISLLNNNYKKYCEKAKIKYTKLPFKPRVYSYAKWHELLSKSNTNFSKEIENYKKKLLKESPNVDIRDLAYKIVLKSYEYYETKEPVLIVFFGSQFYSNIETKDKKLINAVNKAVKEVNKTSKYNITSSYYYPYISDMSFISTPYTKKEINDMLANVPSSLDYPYELIKNIDIPVVNIGTYGKDGHTYIERLEIDYTFNEMPSLVYKTILNYFN